MAINKNEFQQVKKSSGLFIHKKDKTKFLFDFRIDGKRYRKVIRLQQNCWSKSDCVKQAQKQLMQYKADMDSGYASTSQVPKLQKVFETYYDTLDKTKDWTHQKLANYERYIKSELGNKKIDNIKPMHIQKLINGIKSKGLKPRTQKLVLEVLKPLFDFAIQNKLLKEDPTHRITVKVPNQKKVVTRATEKFKHIYQGIKEYYADDPFYQSLFLFGFSGRRKGEILSLKWENVDFENSYYWIEDTKNDDNQKYVLPPFIKEQLILINDDRSGLVFKSPKTGEKIKCLKTQVYNLKKYLQLETFSMHYMRNVLVSSLAEQQTEAIVLSGILGHKDVNTINKYLSINHYKSSQEGYNKIDNILDAEDVNSNPS